MNKIERIEELLAKWEAARDNATTQFEQTRRDSGTIALEAALNILKEPSNKVDAGRLKTYTFDCECGWLHLQVTEGFKCRCGKVFND